MKHLIQIIKNNLSFSIIIVSIIIVFYFVYQLISPIFNFDYTNYEQLNFDKVVERFK